MSAKLRIFSYPSILTYVLGAKKNRLTETVLISTNNICFGREIRKIIFNFALLSGGLDVHAVTAHSHNKQITSQQHTTHLKSENSFNK